VAFVVVVVLASLSLAALRRGPKDPAVIVGYTGETTSTPPTEPPTILQPPSTLPPPDLGRAPLPEPGPAVGLKVANGHPFEPAVEFRSDIPIGEDLVFILVLGSDARPKEDLLATRSDSIHLIAVNRGAGRGRSSASRGTPTSSTRRAAGARSTTPSPGVGRSTRPRPCGSSPVCRSSTTSSPASSASSGWSTTWAGSTSTSTGA
jgi:hypothetical protein